MVQKKAPMNPRALPFMPRSSAKNRDMLALAVKVPMAPISMLTAAEKENMTVKKVNFKPLPPAECQILETAISVAEFVLE
jgi:hypothetical protein